MFRKKLSILAMVVLLVLAVALVGCSDKDKEEFDAAFEATGYQGTLEDGSTLIFFKMNDDTMIIAITDATHQGETALTYTDKPVQGDDNKTTVTDEEYGESITFVLTENGGTASIEVDGRGKGELTVYEGNVLSILGTMAQKELDL